MQLRRISLDRGGLRIMNRNTVLIDVDRLKMEFWDRLAAIDSDPERDDEEVLVELEQQRITIRNIESAKLNNEVE